MGFIMGSNLIWVISNFIHNAWTQVISGLRNVLSSTLESYSSALGQFLLSALMFVNLHVGDITLVLLTRSLNCSTKCFPLWNPLLIAMVGNYMLFFIRLSNSSLIFRAKWSNCSQIAKMQHVTLGCSVSLWKLFSFEPLIICLLKLSGSQGLSEYVLLANKSYWFWQLECSSRFFFKYISSLFGPFIRELMNWQLLSRRRQRQHSGKPHYACAKGCCVRLSVVSWPATTANRMFWSRRQSFAT